MMNVGFTKELFWLDILKVTSNLIHFRWFSKNFFKDPKKETLKKPSPALLSPKNELNWNIYWVHWNDFFLINLEFEQNVHFMWDFRAFRVIFIRETFVARVLRVTLGILIDVDQYMFI